MQWIAQNFFLLAQATFEFGQAAIDLAAGNNARAIIMICAGVGSLALTSVR